MAQIARSLRCDDSVRNLRDFGHAERLPRSAEFDPLQNSRSQPGNALQMAVVDSAGNAADACRIRADASAGTVNAELGSARTLNPGAADRCRRAAARWRAKRNPLEKDDQ